MLHEIPEFDHYYVAYLKDDPAKEPVATNYSAPGVLAEAARKTGRAKADFELRVRVAPTAQSVMCICRSKLEKFAVVSAHHRLRPFFCRAARLAKSSTCTFAAFINEEGRDRLLRHMTRTDEDDVIRRALEWCEVYS